MYFLKLNYEHYFNFFQLTMSKHTQISAPRITLPIGNCIFLQMTRKLQLTGCRSKLLYR